MAKEPEQQIFFGDMPMHELFQKQVQQVIEQVAEDVRQGYVSVKAAAEKYGVVVDPRTFALDRAGTERLRAAR